VSESWEIKFSYYHFTDAELLTLYFSDVHVPLRSGTLVCITACIYGFKYAKISATCTDKSSVRINSIFCRFESSGMMIRSKNAN
jgi:hypothetical protein